MKFFLMIFAIPVVIVMRILRPFIVIRLGELDISRIGGGAYSADWYLSERYAGKHCKRNFDVFYFILNAKYVVPVIF